MKKVLLLLIGIIAALSLAACAIEPITPDETGNNGDQQNDCENGNHDYTTTVVEPTCTEDGYTLYGCKNCENSFADTMHNYIDDMCTNCGAILKTSEGLEYEINDDGTAYSVVGVVSCVDINVVIPSKHEGLPVTYIGSDAFCSCDSLTTVYYTGTAEEWAEIEIDSYNENLTSATRYYYSETEPTTEGNFWYYNDKGEIVIW